MTRSRRQGWRAIVCLALIAAILPAVTATRSPSARAASPDELRPRVEATLDFVMAQVRGTIADLPSSTAFPRSTVGGAWETVPAADWTSGFFPALLWQLYLATGASDFLTAATSWSTSLASQATRTDTHDIGFSVGLPASLAYEATGKASYKNTLLTAATSLASGFDSDVGAVRSWISDSWQFPVFVDGVMTVDLLMEGADVGSAAQRSAWRSMARSHGAVTRSEHLRGDGSTFGVVDFNPNTGGVISRQSGGTTTQSTWARGQAWAMYGLSHLFTRTGDAADLAAARDAADYFIGQLPADGIPPWAFGLPSSPAPHRDASAAAIGASALLELSTTTSGAAADRYFEAASDILESLMSSSYLSNGSNSAGVLLHVTGSHPPTTEVDVSTIYADYFFTEALIRYLEIVPGPDADPTVTITAPAAGAMAAMPVTIRGTAADDRAVAHVLVSIRDQASGRFWNGTNFQAASTHDLATLASPGSPATSWMYTFDLDTLPPSSQPYTVSVRSVDSAVQFSPSTSRAFGIPDTQPPSITLLGVDPQVIEVTAAYAELGAVAVDVVDGDVSGSISVDTSALNTNSVGSYDVSYSVGDASSNLATATRTVDVVDVTAPVITLSGDNPTVLAVGATYTEFGATATDDVDGNISGSLLIDVSTVNPAQAGGYRATFDVSDAAGNPAVQGVRVVLVVGGGNPEMALFGSDPQLITVDQPYVELGAAAWDDADGDLSGAIVIDATDVDTSVLGNHEVTYDVSDSVGNTRQLVRTVTVVDDVRPVLAIVGSDPQVVPIGGPYVELGATASDNVDGDLAGSIVVDASRVDTSLAGYYTVTYTVSDAAGNHAAPVVRLVRIAGDEPPDIALKGLSPLRVPFGDTYEEFGASARDPEDGDIGGSISIDTTNVDTSRPGVYLSRYEVRDSTGNLVVATRPVEVLDYFVDDDTSVFQRDINAIAMAGLTQGCNPPANSWYCLRSNVTRGQFAAMLARAIDLDLTVGVETDLFGDDDASVFEPFINALAATGIVKGCDPPTNTRFCPKQNLTRGQAAVMFVRAFGYTDAGVGNAFTDDDGSVFEGFIDKLAEAGVTKGCDPPANTRFCPGNLVTRGQIAAFFARALGI